MALPPDTDDRIARHWAERLGCSPTASRESGVTVVAGSTDDTVRLIRRGDALVVAAPEQVRTSIETHREALADADLPATAAVERALADRGASVDAVYGPYGLGYVDEPSFSPVDSEARLLVGADEPAFERLQERVPDDEWARASPVFRPGQTAGLFRDGDLVAVATLTHLPFPDVGVVVDPEQRGRGYGRAVVSLITATAFDIDTGAVVRYRTRESAAASVALANSLGYERWARSAVLVLDQGSP
ncbi:MULTISPECIES: GNAT family N-acetyltransferase [Halolamina]|uniref:Ribosomal protein S18 acetylase RimI n=1 Tax=Halolamina pelagica TaxID=699431 RepID=A0A1I5M4M9_9EURY|nr:MULTISPECIES: GNAT family N-acetyltransferase [Halolamina]NHX35843.1 GNAT family N-acetyltransferase [Halolamina sp. R1-12]SFP03991.1 Ribosomal protein S18 acetylase RimI [Halolamina pelagica]